MTMRDTGLTEKEIKKEVISQIYYVLTDFDGIVKDLDDNCEDIYNKVFVPLLEKTRKETAKEIFSKLREKSTESFLDEEGNICYLDEEYVSMREIEAELKQFGVEVQDE